MPFYPFTNNKKGVKEPPGKWYMLTYIVFWHWWKELKICSPLYTNVIIKRIKFVAWYFGSSIGFPLWASSEQILKNLGGFKHSGLLTQGREYTSQWRSCIHQINKFWEGNFIFTSWNNVLFIGQKSSFQYLVHFIK